MNSRHLSHFRRRVEGKTNYKKRLNLLISNKPRMVVRRSNTKIIAQIIVSDHGQDKAVVAVDSTSLTKSGWKGSLKNIPAAYLTGLQLASIAKSNKIDNAILDIGLLTPTKGATIFAVLKGAVDGGLEIPHSSNNIPSDERISGAHIDAYKKTTIAKDFDVVKKKILGGSSVKPVKKASVKGDSKSKK
ncbi:MAG: 50S ribosomal protein L18 [Nanohaloarchaea archaeon]|nr:50S ribosomal protein L18 [Candidatus Nanohaloarchaea archaeon]